MAHATTYDVHLSSGKERYHKVRRRKTPTRSLLGACQTLSEDEKKGVETGKIPKRLNGKEKNKRRERPLGFRMSPSPSGCLS
jgi:hypothetical protein